MKSMRTLDAIVHAISLASATSRSYELRAADGALPPFDAGAHLDVHLGPSLDRQHSLCNSPRKSGRYLICVRREHATAQRHVQVAGGIGITPLLSMAEAPHGLRRRNRDRIHRRIPNSPYGSRFEAVGATGSPQTTRSSPSAALAPAPVPPNSCSASDLGLRPTRDRPGVMSTPSHIHVLHVRCEPVPTRPGERKSAP